MSDRELEEALREVVKTAEARHAKNGIDYWNALQSIINHPMTPNAIRDIAERACR